MPAQNQEICKIKENLGTVLPVSELPDECRACITASLGDLATETFTQHEDFDDRNVVSIERGDETVKFVGASIIHVVESNALLEGGASERYSSERTRVQCQKS